MTPQLGHLGRLVTAQHECRFVYADLGRRTTAKSIIIDAVWFVLWSIPPTIAGSPLDDMSAHKQAGAPHADADVRGRGRGLVLNWISLQREQHVPLQLLPQTINPKSCFGQRRSQLDCSVKFLH